MKKYAHWLQSIAMHRLKQYKGKWIPAKETRNLPRIHEKYKQKNTLYSIPGFLYWNDLTFFCNGKSQR